MNPTPLLPRCLCIDIETAVADALDIHKFAGWRPDTQKSLYLNGGKISASLQEIDALTDGAAFVLGHNVIRHDLPALAKRYPSLKLNQLPAVDTLELSPIAFPANPYHMGVDKSDVRRVIHADIPGSLEPLAKPCLRA